MNDRTDLGTMEQTLIRCRNMAGRLGLVLNWRIRERTGTAIIRQNNRIIWQQSFTHEYPHMVIYLVYTGMYTELDRRETENKEAIYRMKEMEQERLEEKRVAGLPNWAERRRQR